MMRCCKDDKLDHSFIIQTFNMLTEYFTPNNRMYDYYNTRFRILKSIKIDYNSDKNATLYSLLESHSKNKFPEIEPPARKEISSKNFKSSFEEEDSAHNTAEHKYSTYSQSRNTFILPNMAGKTNEVQGYQEIYNGLEAMFDTNKVMVVMPSSFDIKDKDGNLLFTVENNDLYEDGDEDEEYFSTEDIEDDEEELDIPVINKNPLNNNGNGSNNKPKK